MSECILHGFLLMGVLGAVVGVGLALASKIFYVYVDPKVEAVDDALPGANCGGCGLPGCSSNAAAVVRGEASASSCVAGGPEIAAEIAEIMGVKLEIKEPEIARPGCTYGVQDADLKFIYSGADDCRAAILLNGGAKVCPVGCLGLGTCASACPFGALSMGPDYLPVVNETLCTGCGTCERICPKNIITLSSNFRRIQQEYATDDCTTPCQRACPAGVNIPVYISEISEGRYLDAVRIIKESNPFPSVCGRICVHPCEEECRRMLVDAPVAINHLKRFATDYERSSGAWVLVPRAPETEKRVAIVGGGAEGMTAAYFLNRLGHDSTVYESASRLGGILRIGLPENRLPVDILDWDINGILDAGVQAHTNQRLGRDFTMESLLKDGYSAVFVATGGWDTQLSERARDGFPQPLPGVRLLVDFVLRLRDGKNPSAGKHVMILGGGNAAFEAAGACAKDGAETVYVVFRTSRERASVSEEELKKAEDEGIRLLFNSALCKMVGEGNNLTHVEVVQTSGEGSEIFSVDTLLTGTGRFPELIYVPQRKEDEGDEEQPQDLSKWETVVPYPGPSVEDDIGIFRQGEVIGDYKSVVEAIGSGRRAAGSIQRFLTGDPVAAPANMVRRYTQVINIDKLEPVPQALRENMSERSQEDQPNDPSAEIALGYSEEQAVRESKRCLQCGLICYRRVQGKLY